MSDSDDDILASSSSSSESDSDDSSDDDEEDNSHLYITIEAEGINKIEFCTSLSENNMEQPDGRGIIESLRSFLECLPPLRSLSIDFETENGYHHREMLEVVVSTVLVKSAPHLVEFSITSVAVKTLRGLVVALLNCVKLETLVLIEACLTKTCVADLVTLVEQSSHLVEVVWQCCEFKSCISALNGMQQFTRAISTSPTIKHLYLGLNKGDPSITGLEHCTNLEAVVISMGRRQDDITTVVTSLLTNDATHLKSLEIEKGRVKRPKRLGEALKMNSTLESLQIDWKLGHSCQKTVSAVGDALRTTNCTLKNVVFGPLDIYEEWTPKIDYYCLFNAYGRATMRESGTSKADMVKLLLSLANNDNDHAWYRPFHEDSVRYGLLRESPHVWCHHVLDEHEQQQQQEE